MRWTVIPGDRREVEAAAHLVSLGHEVALLGDGETEHFASADAVLGPALGTNAAGDAFPRQGEPLAIDARWLHHCRPGTPWLIGRAGPWLVRTAAEAGVRLYTYAARDDFALRNAVPTAEGAIFEAARRSGRTAWGTTALVVGGGRCARALVSRLRGLDARVTCAARSAAARADCELLGAETVPFEGLAAAAAGAIWIFNTVPAPVLTREVLGACAASTVVDIASAPGGTDFAAAAALGVDAALVLGIPGRMFPRTAGRIVAETALELLAAARKEVADHGCI